MIKDPSNPFDISIIDFGYAIQEKDVQEAYKKDSSLQIETIVGTPGFIAPECLKGEVYDSKADVFSAGCVLYMLQFERQFLFDSNFQKILSKNKNCDFDEIYKNDLKTLHLTLHRYIYINTCKQ